MLEIMTLRHMPSGPRQYKDELKNALVEPSTKCKGFKSLMACTISVVLNIILSYLSTNCIRIMLCKNSKDQSISRDGAVLLLLLRIPVGIVLATYV